MKTPQLMAMYSTQTVMPPIGVLVVVKWVGRPTFEASRVRHPQTGKLCWLTKDDADRPIFLPTESAPSNPREPWAGWHTLRGDPAYWRPKHPEKWTLPLPEPAYVDDGYQPKLRMWSSTMTFGAVEEAESEDLAREMEADREAARAGGRAPDPEDLAEPQWWLDPNAVLYSPAGHIRPREAEGRVMRALITERAGRLERPIMKTASAVIARFGTADPIDPMDLAAQDPVPIRIEPTARDRDDELVALGWLMALLEGQQVVIRLRSFAPPASWREIGSSCGLSPEGARKRFAGAITALTEVANERCSGAQNGVQQQLAALRARNRAFKRSQ